MRNVFKIILAVLFAILLSGININTYAVNKQIEDLDILEDALKDEFSDEETAEEEDDEFIEEDVEEEVEEAEPEAEPEADMEEEIEQEEQIAPTIPSRLPFRRTRGEREPAFTGEGEEIAGDKIKVIIDLMVNLSYVFNNSPDSFEVKYHIQVESKEFATKTSVFRGDTTVEASVKGFLAKWETGECKLDISIPKTPFQATVRQNEENLSINFRFSKKVTEQWKSICTFGEGVKPFETIGASEEWFQRALSKSSPPLGRLVANITPGQKTTSDFLINTFIFNDPPLGSVEVSGKGTITVLSGEGVGE